VSSVDPQTKLGYLETTGRVSGLPRETEIWFALEQGRLYILSGGGVAKDWIRNAQQRPDVRFRIGDTWLTGRFRIVTDAAEEMRARHLLGSKYYGLTPDSPDLDPNHWVLTATPVIIDLNGA
jgi:deazaflavin-dependent oxidoreductase (nitroreductase family)